MPDSKTVVVTGSTRGIGLGLAAQFLKRDCQVVVSGRSQEAVDRVVERLGEGAGRAPVAGRACDITSASDLHALWDFARDAFGQVDVWINNAGISITRAPLWEQSIADLEAIVKTNLTGVLLAGKVVMAGMREQGGGQIWNMEGFGSNGMTGPGWRPTGRPSAPSTTSTRRCSRMPPEPASRIGTLSPGIVVTDLLIGDYDTASEEWRKAKRMFNILGDPVETVTPFLADGVLNANKQGARVVWLTGGKAFRRFLTARFNKRDLFAHLGV